MVVANNGINNTVGASVSGVTNTFTCTNPSNTASSVATIVATVGGATAGDAMYQASTTTTTWSWGCDNSVTSPTADPFVISQGTALGTTNIMSVATSGEINYPLQPCFLADKNSDSLNVTGDGTTFTVTMTNEILDYNGDYASSTFTAPVTGKYQFFNSIIYGGVLSTHTASSQTFVTSNRSYAYTYFSATRCANTINNQVCTTGSVLADMDSADTCYINMDVSNGTKVIDILQGTTSFSGFLQA